MFARARHFLALPIFFAAATAAAQTEQKPGDFAGSWTAWVCPPGVQPDSGNCSSFVLAIFQKQERLCGSHLFATAGAKAMDEGGTPSLLGTATGNEATVTVESGRSDTRVPAELKLTAKGALQWRRLEAPAGDFLLPAAVHLTRVRRGALFSPVFEQRLSATCSAHLNAPRPEPAPAAPAAATAAPAPAAPPPAPEQQAAPRRAQ